MKRSLLAMLLVSFMSSCTVMHAVTGDAMFRPEDDGKQQAVRGPNVPEPEPQDAELEAGVEEARQPSQPATAAAASSGPVPVTKAKAKKKTPKLAAVDID